MEIPNHTKSDYLRLLDISFKELLRKKKPNEIKTWLSFIGTINANINSKQLKIIYNFQNSNSKLVRQGLMNALIGINSKEAINISINLTYDKYRMTRYWATFNLINHIKSDNKQIRVALWDRTNDNCIRIRRMAIAGLAKRKEYRVKELLKKEFKKKPGSDLIQSIYSICDIELVTLLKENINRISDNTEWTNKIILDIEKYIKK